MEPNGKFYTQYSSQPQQYQAQPPKKSRGKAILLTVLALILIVGVGSGAYFYQQQRIDTLSNEKSQLTRQLTEAASKDIEADVTPSQFSYPKAPFVFDYPGDWTLTSSEPVTYTESLPAEYGIELLAPGTVRSVTLSGVPDVISKNGARITIKKTPATEADVRKALVFSGAAPTFTDATVAGIKGVSFEYMNDGPKYVASAVIKDGALFVVRFDAEDDADLTKNDFYSTYQTLVSSFQFK
jgi:hypothetical protein